VSGPLRAFESGALVVDDLMVAINRSGKSGVRYRKWIMPPPPIKINDTITKLRSSSIGRFSSRALAFAGLTSSAMSRMTGTSMINAVTR